MKAFLVLLTVSVLLSTVAGGCSDGSTPEQIKERRLADISRPPYIGFIRDGKVLTILDDIPEAEIVRVVVQRDDGLILSVLHPRSLAPKENTRINVVAMDYMSSEYYWATGFYLKKE